MMPAEVALLLAAACLAVVPAAADTGVERHSQEVDVVVAAAAADTSWYGTTHHGPEFVNVLDFGAIGDGVHDDTGAIQDAINHGRLQSGMGPAPTARPFAPPRRAIVYLPPGMYVLSDTVVLWFFTHLRGSTVDPPVLLLKAHAPGFGNYSALKPLLATAGGCNQSVPWWRDNFHANDMFYNQIHSVKIRVEAGNGGTVGIYWSIAQQTSLRVCAPATRQLLHLPENVVMCRMLECGCMSEFNGNK